jgi:hypothetical protein
MTAKPPLAANAHPPGSRRFSRAAVGESVPSARLPTRTAAAFPLIRRGQKTVAASPQVEHNLVNGTFLSFKTFPFESSIGRYRVKRHGS